MGIRQFKLIGSTFQDDCSAIIEINGQIVHSGPLTPATNNGFNPIATGSIDIPNDSIQQVVPVSITVTSGTVGVGMFQWNGLGITRNPIYTEEEYEILSDLNLPNSVKIEIVTPHANPPFTDEEIALLQSFGPDDRLLLKALLIEHNCYFRIADEASFAFGNTFDLNRSNRNSIELDGVPSASSEYMYINVNQGQVLTFNQIIFARSDQ